MADAVRAPVPSDDASAHVLDEAERHFLRDGYAGTRLAAVAGALGIRSASLYHHAPGGKRQLWDRVVGRALARHRDGLRAAAQTDTDLRAQLVAMALWQLSQPAVHVVAVAAREPGMAEALYDALMQPVADALRRAQARGEARPDRAPDLFAGVFASAVAGLHAAERDGVLPAPVHVLAEAVASLLVDGAGTR